MDFLTGPVRETAHRGDDDLLSAGLGIEGLRGAASAFANPDSPTPAELRRRAIQSNWKGICALDGFGRVYGAAPSVPGCEYTAFAKIPGANAPHRVLAQIPDTFDTKTRCLIVTASSGSRGVYGAIAFAGGWGLPRGCAVAYTDKGAGSGFFDTADGSGVALDGTRAAAGTAALEFEPAVFTADSGIAVKHAHSADNPEADWGRHLLQAAAFGLAMLDRSLPHLAPFTPQNTRIIAAGLSNGGAAVLQAAGMDADGWLAGAVAVSPNVFASAGGRALYDYATEAALLLPCALAHERFASVPFARANNAVPPPWLARGANLRALGLLQRGDADEALAYLHDSGWSDECIAAAAPNTAFDLWRALTVTYVSAYTRGGVGSVPAGFRFVARNADGSARNATRAERAAWWADSAGIPPGAGVFIDEPASAELTPDDPSLPALWRFRKMWTSGTVETSTLHKSIVATSARRARPELPVFVVHGADDGLVPPAFSSDAYVTQLRESGGNSVYWRLPHVQHFDAFLALPGFGERYVPLLPYAYAALDRVFDHLTHGTALHGGRVPQPKPRGAGPLEPAHLGL